MKSFTHTRSEGGFTLIELVMVIVILGILAAMAVPKFVDLGTDARKSTLQGLQGSVVSAMNMGHALSLAKGNPASISVEGKTVTIANRYPNAATIKDMLNMDGFSSTAADGVATFTVSGASDDTKCNVKYTEAADNNTPPTVVITDTDCS